MTSFRSSSALGTVVLLAAVGCGGDLNSELADEAVGETAEASRGPAHGPAREGELLVTVGADSGAALVRVKEDGTRLVLSDFTNPRQGPLAVEPTALGVERDGDILVLARKRGPAGAPVLLRVDARDGERRIL